MLRQISFKETIKYLKYLELIFSNMRTIQEITFWFQNKIGTSVL